MALNRQLDIDFRKEAQQIKQERSLVLRTLQTADPQAMALPIETAIASRALVKKLWDLLPDESESYLYESDAQLFSEGASWLPVAEREQKVTLHLGWDVLCFTCTLEAAWQCWPQFKHYNTNTYNGCLYPPGLDWYLVQAGPHLYPMVADETSYRLCKHK